MSVFVFSSTVVVSPTALAADTGADVPVIHVCGSGALLVKNNPDGQKETVYPLQIEKSYIEENVKRFLPVFAEAFKNM